MSPAAVELFGRISYGRPLYVSDSRCELAEVRAQKFVGEARPPEPVSRAVAVELINSGWLYRLTRDGEGQRGGYAELDILDADEGEIYVHLQ